VRKPRPTLYAGGESETAKNLIAAKCDAYVMHGDSPTYVAAKIADMSERRDRLGLPPMQFGVAGYAIVRETETEARRELARITDVKQNASGFANYQQWLNGTQLEQRMSIEEYLFLTVAFARDLSALQRRFRINWASLKMRASIWSCCSSVRNMRKWNVSARQSSLSWSYLGSRHVAARISIVQAQFI